MDCSFINSRHSDNDCGILCIVNAHDFFALIVFLAAYNVEKCPYRTM